MDILLHTIALEPARWKLQRTSQPLAELLPAIKQAGFCSVEVFEPHMDFAAASAFRDSEVNAVVLSSYLDLSRACRVCLAAFALQLSALENRL